MDKNQYNTLVLILSIIAVGIMTGFMQLLMVLNTQIGIVYLILMITYMIFVLIVYYKNKRS